MAGVYRYTLDATSKKFICPNCGQKRFTKFVDTVTGEYADDIFGRCDREESCGYFKAPKKGFDNANDFRTIQARLLVSYEKEITAPVSYIAIDIFKKSLNFQLLQTSNFFCAFENLCGKEKLLKSCANFFVGVSATFGDISPVFWQVDNENRVRTAKIMKYDKNGKRDRNLKKSFNFAHTLLKLRNFNLKQVFFGSHLIGKYDTIIIVESEKTALILSTLINNVLFIATSGSNNFANCLKNLGVEVFEKKNVYVLPDKGSGDKLCVERYWTKIKKDFLPNAKMIMLPKEAKVGSDILDVVLELYENEQQKFILSKVKKMIEDDIIFLEINNAINEEAEGEEEEECGEGGECKGKVPKIDERTKNEKVNDIFQFFEILNLKPKLSFVNLKLQS